jgi:flagellar L-ring protein precursor FlgH
MNHKSISYLLTLIILMLPGCYTLDRLEHVGDSPPATPIKDPTKLPNYHPVVMPMPHAQLHERRVNSLWQDGARGFFKDQRAKNKGDILTVNIDISEQMGEITSDTDRSRNTTEKVSVNNFMGYEAKASKVLPEGVDPSNLVGLNSNPTFTGSGTTKRTEKLKLKVPATITQILPNGNYVIHGRQEMRVNFEMREVSITGIIRAEDISSNNIVEYEKIAEARVIFGGRGNVMDFQQPPVGSQVLNHIMPF